ncbi:CDP-diacylglycerol--inositol 3-phosphatidyltransferase-like [Stylophora pistillata]|uniref:CDP-diacylglycerol--inositol 3-phosphatidyltransferase n=1 Tax=Stylophora pistillata TaxID=50429 RepID=A0A2B4RPI9_STYPI|nr:CDP-diacylglycerol--inositol 3-phosphatidyltransferase-like [Stylophora pistillata]PFX18175.1 CDP-diacylglycerol--inositol 3-phosphatidyltransferase [Stylophora pistillata]
MERVFFYIPNLIDYVRIILNLASFYNMTERPFLTVALYFSGGIILDVADGVSARYFKQCSKYGELLDFLLDRCGRVAMMMALCAFYPQHLFLLQLLVCLEVTGSFSNLYRCALVLHPDDVSAKTRSQDPWLVRIFFKEPITTLVIVGQDVCVAMLYLLHFSPGPVVSLGGTSYSLWLLMARIFSPFLIYRQVIVCSLLLLRSFGDLAELHPQQATSDKKS